MILMHGLIDLIGSQKINIVHCRLIVHVVALQLEVNRGSQCIYI